MSNEEMKNIQDRVLASIRSGEIKMRPRWRFLLRATLILLGVIMLILSVIYLVSFILFMLRATGLSYEPLLGLRGWYNLVVSLPWILILLAMVFIVVLELLVRRYAFAYRRPLLYSILSIVVVVTGGSLLVATTPMHYRLSRFVARHQAPFFAEFYGGMRHKRFPGISRGVLGGAATNTIFLITPEGETLQALISPETLLPIDELPNASASILIVGPREGMNIRAFGIRLIDVE